jgi:ribosomal protein S27E
MRIKCHSQGKFYTIECPEGTRLVRSADRPGGDLPFLDHLVVPLNGKTIRISADPPELLPLLAETGNFGVSLVGEPEPDVRLAGVACPGCSEADVNWLQLGEGSEAVRCDRCGAEFAFPFPVPVPAPNVAVTNRPGG